MWLLIALAISLFVSLLKPFTNRLHDTSLWAGKALSPPEFAVENPRGLQEPMTAGWLGTLMFLVSLLVLIAIVMGFVHAWWGGFVIYLATATMTAIAERTPLASRMVERYLMILLSHALNRKADYAVKGDRDRAEAAKDLADQMTDCYRFTLEVEFTHQDRNKPAWRRSATADSYSVRTERGSSCEPAALRSKNGVP